MTEPLPVCYLNGAFMPLREARISPLDRGFMFADSIYEVLPVFGGRMFRFREHFDRLARSLDEIRLPSPHTHAQWLELLNELIRRNGSVEMYVYVQVTRGTEFGRNHVFPAEVAPTVFAMAAPLPAMTDELRANGLSAITVWDFRWDRCDIKATALLANVLMKQRAADVGAHEAIIVRDGEVLEGSSTSIFVASRGSVATPPNSRRILSGTTRDAAIERLVDVIPIQIRLIRLEELRAADEVWLSSATRNVIPVTRIDGIPVGSGKPGPLWKRTEQAFNELIAKLAGTPAM